MIPFQPEIVNSRQVMLSVGIFAWPVWIVEDFLTLAC
jgi:hypothetical protein